MSELGDNQRAFAGDVGRLLRYIYSRGYQVTFGDALAHDGHMDGSFHYKKLAIDLNLFFQGEYLRKTIDHKEFGEYWESLHPDNTWGGRFKNVKGGDGNHYSRGES